MPFSMQSFKNLLEAVSLRSNAACRLLTRHPAPLPRPKLLQARLSPGAAVAAAAGAAGLGGLAAYRSQLLEKDPAAIPLVPQINPLTKDSIRSPVKTLDLDSANKILRQEEKSKRFELGNGQLGRCDSVRVVSNHPTEDEYAAGTSPGPGGQPWTYWGIYDGHAGWATSTVLKESLIGIVSDELSTLPSSAPSPTITAALTHAFTTLDDALLSTALSAVHSPDAHPGSAAVTAALAPAIAGSCALLALYDPAHRTVRVACVGDSRAVLGRSASRNTYTTHPLSADQTGLNPAERARIIAAHPGEDADTMVNPENGRLLGLAVTRAFGDHRWKWSDADIRTAQIKHFATGPRTAAFSPPYLTAEPVISEAVVQRGGDERGRRGDFLILASDGFWEHISSEDAVECVARWVDARRQSRARSSTIFSGTSDTSHRAVSEAMERSKARLEHEEEGFWMEDDKYVEWKATPKHFVVEDDNAATHLVRNAFGGSRRGLFCGVMAAYPPMCRNVRDDTTVQVIFFGDV